MQLTVNTATLARELALAIGVCSKQQSLPILSYFLLEAVKGALPGDPSSLRITACDLDVFVSIEIEAEVDTPGVCAIPSKKLTDYIRLTDAEAVTIKESGSWVHVSAGAKSKTRIATLAADQFPDRPATPDQSIFAVAARELGKAIGRVLPCVTRTASRFTINGALLELADKSSARMVSTDGHRVSLVEVGIEPQQKKPKNKKWLVGVGALGQLAKLSDLAQLGESFHFFENDAGMLFFQLGPRVVVTRATAGTFPDYERVWPKKYEAHFVLDRSALARGVARARLFADERSHGVAIRSTEEGLHIRSAAADSGESEEVVAAEQVGNTLEVGLNAAYVNDFLGVAGTGKVALWHDGGDKVIWFRPVPESAEAEHARRFDYLVMPMRI